MTLSPMVRMDGEPVDERPGRPLGADEDADWVGNREGDHAAAAPDLKSRIDRLNTAGVTGGSSGKYGAQQRFNASTRRPMSSLRQKR